MSKTTIRTTPAPLSYTANLNDDKYDSLVVVSTTLSDVKDVNATIGRLLIKQSEADTSFEKEGCFLVTDLPAKRLIYAPTGPVDRDYDDVRRFSESAAKGMKRAIAAGSTKPLLVVVPNARYENSVLVSVLAALQTLYTSLHFRETKPTEATKVTELGIWAQNEAEAKKVGELALALESGRYVARDLGGGDPERMAPPKFATYVEQLFANSSVEVDVISDRKKIFETTYPLFAAVDRAASAVERHQGRIVYLTYTGEGPITQTLLPCGKGITYDTGGADIKVGGHMAGMSRDKCGAAAVVGFFQILNQLKPKGIKAIGGLAIARNSVGEESYVADELIVGRSGKTVKIGNTDAEGRMVMADVLYKLKTLAVNEVNPHLFTIATLTGHAANAYGPYTAVVDNGPAHKEKFGFQVQSAGESLGDMIEVSMVRREDFDWVKSGVAGEDILQFNNSKAPGSPARGHQFAAAFLIEIAGLEKHGLDSDKPIKYTHFDIAGSAGIHTDYPTGAPVLALAKVFLKDQF